MLADTVLLNFKVHHQKPGCSVCKCNLLGQTTTVTGQNNEASQPVVALPIIDSS